MQGKIYGFAKGAPETDNLVRVSQVSFGDADGAAA